MKKSSLVIALVLIGAGAFPCQVAAATRDKELGLSLEAGADVVSSYLWRGQNLGGLSIQPSVTLGYQGVYVSGWWNLGAENWAFTGFYPEMDLTVGFDRWGAQLDFTHLYYFGGEKFLAGNCDMTLDENSSHSTIELHAGLHLGDVLEKLPLSIDWYTTLWGGDGYMALDANGNEYLKRAYSTYIQIGYDIELPFGSVISARVGLTPWASTYTGYEEVWTNANTVGLTNLNLRFEHEFELPHCTLAVFAEGMLNCYGIDKSNVVCPIADRSEQHLNGCIGGSLYIGNEW